MKHLLSHARASRFGFESKLIPAPNSANSGNLAPAAASGECPAADLICPESLLLYLLLTPGGLPPGASRLTELLKSAPTFPNAAAVMEARARIVPASPFAFGTFFKT